MTRAVRILCRVVDNLGDAGVCWRLARQLAGDFGWRVTLTIDRPELLGRFGADPREAVRVEPWPAGNVAPGTAAQDDVLVSAFGCEPPPALRAALAGGPARPLWVHLEYLSAEAWIDGCHGLRSTRPDDGALEHFFYPGFTERSGGLLRERTLLERRDAFVGSPAQRDWLARLGIDRVAGERLVTMFCYRDAPVAEWLAAVAEGERSCRVLVPEAAADDALAAFLGDSLSPGRALRRGRVLVQRIPFLSHDDYDRLLWSADLNFVRGEDSWIRAHWAARPFVWQPYVQADGTHHVKLKAFLERLGAGPAADAMMRAWSGAGALVPAWHAFDAGLAGLAPRYRDWSTQLCGQTDLATRLVAYCAERL
ncbi:MAG TPA: elongation factor P maturation arginine rhamnosyltransferase EarP [Burkholderiaceae bacterium]|nr:elongation factor P maturation arginine rhamnosyltransferase EarP [Burkholderiaceae bacterium]